MQLEPAKVTIRIDFEDGSSREIKLGSSPDIILNVRNGADHIPFYHQDKPNWVSLMDPEVFLEVRHIRRDLDSKQWMWYSETQPDPIAGQKCEWKWKGFHGEDHECRETGTHSPHVCAYCGIRASVGEDA